MAGSIFPCWGLLFAETITVLYNPTFNCTPEFLAVYGVETCQDYWDAEGERLRQRSFELSAYWIILVCVCCGGNVLAFWGFGHASERMNRRVRDDAFYALVRQEVSFFDKRSVGKITSELQEDATRIQTFTGQPIRSLVIAASSMGIGLVLSFYYMWEFAILAILCVPVMGLATSLEMKQMFGEDDRVEGEEESSSPGGIIVETLLNIGTVSALTMEEERYSDYRDAMKNSDENCVRDGLREGVLAGLSMFIQQWINAVQIYFGGWLLFKFPDRYSLNDFLISNFAIIFSLFGLGSAFQDIADRKETEKSASRIFYLLDRQSTIDPLSEDGKILDTSAGRPNLKKKKSTRVSMRTKKQKSSRRNLVKDKDDATAKTEDDLEVKIAVGDKDKPLKKLPEDEILEEKASEDGPSSPDLKRKSAMKKKKSSKRMSSKKLATESTVDKDVAEKTNSDTAEGTETATAEPPSRPKSMKKKSSKRASSKKVVTESTADEDVAKNNNETTEMSTAEPPSKTKSLKKKKSSKKKSEAEPVVEKA